MRRRVLRAMSGIILGTGGLAAPQGALAGQEHLTVRTDVMLYGDNTEFRNPFREGETIFGAAVRPALDVSLNPRVTVTLGAVANQRFGSESAFETVRPVVSVAFHAGSSTFLIGTLPGPRARLQSDSGGPDREGPHGLLPPLQRETLTFERPFEAGLQWTVAAPRLRQEVWINWQRLNTAEHRERFDAGVNGTVAARGGFSLPYQLHIVHEGGQLFAVGPVADSIGAAAGVLFSGVIGPTVAASLELYALASRHVPDRERPDRTKRGAGFLGRAAAARGGWRGHLLFWRGDDFITDEGDRHYLSVRRDGRHYRGIRDYAETGLTRTFQPARGVALEASGRLHRIETHYEYSFRLLCVARLAWQLR